METNELPTVGEPPSADVGSEQTVGKDSNAELQQQLDQGIAKDTDPCQEIEGDSAASQTKIGLIAKDLASAAIGSEDKPKVNSDINVEVQSRKI